MKGHPQSDTIFLKLKHTHMNPLWLWWWLSYYAYKEISIPTPSQRGPLQIRPAAEPVCQVHRAAVCKMSTLRVHLSKRLEGALAKANSAFSGGVLWVPLNSGSIKVVSRHLTICTHSRKIMHLNIFHAHCLICILTSRNQCVLYSLFQHTQHIYNIISL